MASSIVANGMSLDQILHVLGQDVELQVHSIARLCRLQVRILERVRNNCDRKSSGTLDGCDCQADAVDCNGSLFNNIAGFGGGMLDLEIPCVAFTVEAPDTPNAIHVALHDVAAETRIGSHRPLEIDQRTDGQTSKTGSIQCFAR